MQSIRNMLNKLKLRDSKNTDQLYLYIQDKSKNGPCGYYSYSDPKNKIRFLAVKTT